MRRLAKLQVSADFIVTMLKDNAMSLQCFRVKENALPDDAKITWLEADERTRTVYVVLESESFDLVATNAVPELPLPVCETVFE